MKSIPIKRLMSLSNEQILEIGEGFETSDSMRHIVLEKNKDMGFTILDNKMVEEIIERKNPYSQGKEEVSESSDSEESESSSSVSKAMNIAYKMQFTIKVESDQIAYETYGLLSNPNAIISVSFMGNQLDKIRHDTVCHIVGKESDRKFSELDLESLQTSDANKSPDFWELDGDVLRIIEIKTSTNESNLEVKLNDINESYAKAVDEIKTAYQKKYAKDLIVQFGYLICYPDCVYSNMKLKEEWVMQIIMHFRMGSMMYSRVQLNTEIVEKTDEIAIKKDIKKSLMEMAEYVKSNLKEEDIGPFITHRMIKKMGEPVTKEEEVNLYKVLLEETVEFKSKMDTGRDKVAVEKNVFDFWKRVNSVGKDMIVSQEKISHLIKIPFIIPTIVHYDGVVVSFKEGNFPAKTGAEKFILRIMRRANVIDRPWLSENVEYQRKIAMQGGEMNDKKLKKDRNVRARVRLDDIENEIKFYLCSRGAGSLKMRKELPQEIQMQLNEIDKDSKKRLNEGNFTGDIEDFVNKSGEWWFTEIQKDINCDLIKRRCKDLYDDAKLNSGSKTNFSGEFFDRFYKTRIGHYTSFLDVVMEEINLSMKQLTKSREFIVKQLKYYKCWLILKPTPGNKPIRTMIVIEKNEFNEPWYKDGENKIFSKWHDCGNYKYCDFFTLNEDKMSQFLDISSKMCVFFHCFIEIFKGDYRSEFVGKKMMSNPNIYKSFLICMLQYMTAKKKNNDIFQQCRFGYMNVLEDNIDFCPNPTNFLKKIDENIRNRLGLWMVKKLIINFKLMGLTRPRLMSSMSNYMNKQDDLSEISEIEGSNTTMNLPEDSEDAITADKMVDLLNCFTGDKVDTFEQALQIVYIGSVSSKGDLGEILYAYRTIVDKIVDQSTRFYEANKNYQGNEEPHDLKKIKHREFSTVYARLERQNALNFLNEKSNGRFVEQIEVDIIDTLYNYNVVNLATLKSTALRSHTNKYNEETLKNTLEKGIEKQGKFMDPNKQKYNKRSKLLKVLYDELEGGKVQVNPFTDILSIYKTVELEGLYMHVFAKEQTYGSREILILTYQGRILALLTETIANCINQYLNNEYNSKGAEKVKAKTQFYTALASKLKATESKPVITNNALDGSKWANGFVMSVFAYQFYGVIPDYMFYCCVGVFNLFSRKRIEIPAELIRELFGSNEKKYKYFTRGLEELKKACTEKDYLYDYTKKLKDLLIMRVSVDNKIKVLEDRIKEENIDEKTNSLLMAELTRLRLELEELNKDIITEEKMIESNDKFIQLKHDLRPAEYMGVVMSITDGFGQGLQGKVSSYKSAIMTLFHVKICQYITSYFSEKLEKEFNIKDGFGRRCKPFIRWMTTSDDSESTIALLLDEEKFDNRTVLLVANLCLVIMSLLIKAMGKKTCIDISDDKSRYCISKISEFNSTWTIFNTTILPWVKWANSVMNDVSTTTLKDKQILYGNACKDILKGGGKIITASICQEAHFRMFYSDLGANVSPLFDEAKKYILELKHPSVGYFAFEPENCCGLLGKNFALYNLHLRSEKTRSVEQMLRNMFGTTYDSNGNVSVMFKIYPGEKKRMLNWIKKFEFKENVIRKLEKDPLMMYRNPKTKEEARAMMTIKAMDPNIGISLLRLKNCRTKSLGVYLMIRSVITVVDLRAEKEFKRSKKIEFLKMRSEKTDIQRLSEYIDVEDVQFVNSSKMSMFKLLSKLSEEVNGMMELFKNFDMLKKRNALRVVLEESSLGSLDSQYLEVENYYNLCFPHSEMYDKANKILDEISEENIIELQNPRPNRRMVLVSSNKRTFFKVGLKSLMSYYWLGVQTGMSPEANDLLLKQYKVIYPWLDKNIEECLINSPFNSHIQLATMINRPSDKLATFEVVGPVRGMNDRTKLISIMTMMWSANYIVSLSGEQKRDKTEMGGIKRKIILLDSKILKIRDCPLLGMREKNKCLNDLLENDAETELVSSEYKDEGVSSLLNRLTQHDKSLVVIQIAAKLLSSEDVIKLEAVNRINDLLSIIKMGVVGFYAKAQEYRRDANTGEFSYRGDGIYMLSIINLIFRISLYDDAVVLIEVNSLEKYLKGGIDDMVRKVLDELGFKRYVYMPVNTTSKPYIFGREKGSRNLYIRGKNESVGCLLIENKNLSFNLSNSAMRIEFGEYGNIRLRFGDMNVQGGRWATMLSYRPDFFRYEQVNSAINQNLIRGLSLAEMSFIKKWDNTEEIKDYELYKIRAKLEEKLTVARGNLEILEEEDDEELAFIVLNDKINRKEASINENKEGKEEMQIDVRDMLGDKDFWYENKQICVAANNLMSRSNKRYRLGFQIVKNMIQSDVNNVEKEINWLNQTFISLWKHKFQMEYGRTIIGDKEAEEITEDNEDLDIEDEAFDFEAFGLGLQEENGVPVLDSLINVIKSVTGREELEDDFFIEQQNDYLENKERVEMYNLFSNTNERFQRNAMIYDNAKTISRANVLSGKVFNNIIVSMKSRISEKLIEDCLFGRTAYKIQNTDNIKGLKETVKMVKVTRKFKKGNENVSETVESQLEQSYLEDLLALLFRSHEREVSEQVIEETFEM